MRLSRAFFELERNAYEDCRSTVPAGDDPAVFADAEKNIQGGAKVMRAAGAAGAGHCAQLRRESPDAALPEHCAASGKPQPK